MLYFSKTKVIIVILVSLFFLFFSFLNIFNLQNNLINKKINLGLDLQGGSYLLLEIDEKPVLTKTLQNKLTQIRSFFKEKQISVKNLKIYKEEFITFSSDKSNIEMIIQSFQDDQNNLNIYYPKFKSFQYEITNLDGDFELKLSKYGIIEIKNLLLDQAIEIVRRRVDEVGTNEPNILKRGNNRILVELPGLEDPMRIKNLLGKTANLSFRFITNSVDDSFGTDKLEFEETGEIVNVNKRIILSGENLVDAQPRMDTQNNQTIVSFNLDRVGAKRFGKATTQGVGQRLAIILDNKIISAPRVREPILGGSGQITGDFTFQSATDLALLLRSGALPAPMNIVEERTVGPDLGEDSIRAGIFALIIGFILVIIYMLYKYRIFGLIANTALIINLICLTGILTLFEATLTLPGIAGIILTVGMAVDANVLIFERIKEEKYNEKNQIIAFDSGYTKSKTAILDANITTFISAIILFFLGSGPIKGFSITLGIGILTTLFSVYFIARLLTSLYLLKNKDKEIKI